MRTLPRAAALILFVVSLCVFLLPYSVQLETVRQSVAARLSATIGGEVRAQGAHWHWFPLPHLVFDDLQFTSGTASGAVPELAFYPRWGIVVGRAGRVVARRPQLRFRGLVGTGGQKSPGAPVGMAIEVEDGEARFDLHEDVDGILPARGITFSSINGRLALKGPELLFSLKGASSAVDSLGISGTVDVAGRSYTLRIDSEGCSVGAVLRALLGDEASISVEGTARVEGTIEGSGAKRQKVAVRVSLSPLALARNGRETVLGESSVDAVVERDESGVRIALETVDLASPRITVEGTVGRTTAPTAGAAPVWDVALRSKGADLAGIREVLLAVWGDSTPVRRVCDVVRGGIAGDARFDFTGPVNALNSIASMSIEADLKDSVVHVPQIGMRLSSVEGRVEIRDGVLRGGGLSARSGRSIGSRGTLVVDLLGDEAPFLLGLDLDADVSGLLPLLGKTVKNESFLKEMKRFRDVRGRGRGRLDVTDTPRGMTVDVRLRDGEIHTGYDRTPWPLVLHEGSLSAVAGRVFWKDVQAAVGPHTIRNTAGSADWTGNAGVRVVLDRLDASCDAEEMYRFLRNEGILPPYFADLVTSVEGRLELGNTAFHGFLDDPSTLRYTTTATGKNLGWTSSKLPGPVVAKKAAATITDSGVRITDGSFSVLERPLEIRTDLSHREFRDWRGWMQFDGIVYQDLADWLEQQEWFPRGFVPRAPMELVGFRVDLKDDGTNLAGEMVAVEGKDAGPRLKIDVGISADRLDLRTLAIISGAQEANLSCRFTRHAPTGPHECAGRGVFSFAVLDDFLVPETPLSGTLRGDYRISLGGDGTNDFSGVLEGSGLEWKWGDPPAQGVGLDFAVRGAGNRLVLDALMLRVDGEAISGKGVLVPAGDGVSLDLALSSQRLSWATIGRFIGGLRTVGTKNTATGDEKERQEEADRWPWHATGAIAFDVDSFFLEKDFLPGYGGSGREAPRLDALEGTIELAGDDRSTVTVRSSRLCDIRLNGRLHSSGEHTTAIYRLSSDRTSPPRLENTLSCLGIDESRFEGPFDFDAIVEKKGDVWSRGRVRLRSAKGRIHRAAVLARAIDAVDETGVLTDAEEEEFQRGGMGYTSIDFAGEIADNVLTIDRYVVVGELMDYFVRGSLDLGSLEGDGTLLIAPLRKVDTLVTKIPLFGRVLGGEHDAIITIAVGITGDIRDPELTILPPSAIGQGLWNIVKNTLLIPVRIFDWGREPDPWEEELRLPGEQGKGEP